MLTGSCDLVDAAAAALSANKNITKAHAEVPLNTGSTFAEVLKVQRGSRRPNKIILSE